MEVAPGTLVGDIASATRLQTVNVESPYLPSQSLGLTQYFNTVCCWYDHFAYLGGDSLTASMEVASITVLVRQSAPQSAPR
jgi:hypothetical protein